MGKILDAIDAQIIKPRMISSEKESFIATKTDIQNFYTQGNPKYYAYPAKPKGTRTGAYGKSPRSTGVSGAKGNYKFSIYLEEPKYTTGTFDGHTVLEQIQWRGSGILGKAGTWFEAQQDIKSITIKNFT